jgi:hypothetical protein
MPGLSSEHDGQEDSETTEVDAADYATALYTLLKIVRSVGSCPKADENRVSNSNDEEKGQLIRKEVMSPMSADSVGQAPSYSPSCGEATTRPAHFTVSE